MTPASAVQEDLFEREFRLDRRFKIKHRQGLADGNGNLIGWSYNDESQFQLVGHQIVPRWFVVWLPGDDREPGLVLEADLVGEHMTCTRVHLLGKPGKGITGKDLKLISPDALVSQVTKLLSKRATIETHAEKDGGRWVKISPHSGVRTLTKDEKHSLDAIMPRRGPKGLSNQHYADVARIYEANGRKVHAVAESFNRPFTTAARWVREAKKRGLLSED